MNGKFWYMVVWSGVGDVFLVSTNHDGSRRMRFDILVRFIHISLDIEQTGRFVNIVSKEQCSECSESDSADHHLHVYSSTVRYILYYDPPAYSVQLTIPSHAVHRSKGLTPLTC